MSSGTLTNAATGAINVLTGSGGGRTITATLDNQGTVTLSRPLTMNGTNATHTNSGTIALSGGDLTLTQSAGTGSFTNTSTGVVTLTNDWSVSGGTLNLSAGSVGGAGLLSVSNSTLNYVPASLPPRMSLTTVTVTGGLTIPNAQTLTLETSNFASAVTVATGGTLVIRRAVTLSGALLTPGTLRLQGTSGYTGALTVTNGWTNAGTIELTDISGNAASLVVSSGTLTNGPTGTITILTGSNGGRTITATLLDNQGTMTVSRSLALNAALEQRNILTVPVGPTLAITGSLTLYPLSVTTVDGTLSASLGCTSPGTEVIVGGGSYPVCS